MLNCSNRFTLRETTHTHTHTHTYTLSVERVLPSCLLCSTDRMCLRIHRAKFWPQNSRSQRCPGYRSIWSSPSLWPSDWSCGRSRRSTVRTAPWKPNPGNPPPVERREGAVICVSLKRRWTHCFSWKLSDLKKCALGWALNRRRACYPHGDDPRQLCDTF